MEAIFDSNSANLVSNFFNSIQLYSPKDFGDDFKHINFIKNNKRGYGYWIWKLYFILKRFDEITYNDILIYTDAGSSINKNGKRRLYEYISLLNDQNDNDIICFQMTHLEYKYTKNDIFEFLKINKDNQNSGQIHATVIIMRKTERLYNFLKMMYNINSNNYNLIDDTIGYTKNHDEFIDCRHDQSIFSVMIKQYYNNKIIIPEETWPSSGDWNEIKHIPIQAKRIRYI